MRGGNAFVFAVLVLGSVVMAIPFVWMFTTSLDWDAVANMPFPPRFWPLKPSLQTYHIAMLNVPLLKYIWNSLVVSFFVILISTVSACASGYALSKIKFRGSRLVLILALSTMMIPFEITMIPLYQLFNKLNLLNSYWAFYLPAITYGFGTFLAKQFMDQLPSSLREAAIVDGSGEFTIFTKIFIPLCGPMIATLVILHFLGVWNDFLWPLLVIQDADKYTVQIGMAMFKYNKGESDYVAIVMAATMISLLPILVVYLFLQRYIIESIALTGIKQ
ncbi:carbohydrate ABC transporter permease [Paenibacillus sp. CC-CFT747]|nr:carbohydrate ABC transporter permease [Paenibacillus sp. CC-CFT747]